MRYNTRQRELILECLAHSKGQHITAEDISEYLRKNDTPVGKSTIYRYLEALVKDCVVRKYTIEEGKCACYQYMGDEENDHCKEHYHLKCSECGRLFHVSCALLDEINEHVRKEHNFIIDSSKTVFYGICGECNR